MELASVIIETVFLIPANPLVTMTIEVVSGALRGLGYFTIPTVLSAIFVCGVQVVWVLLIFPHVPTFQMLMAVYPISWSAAAIAVTAAYLIVKERLTERDALPS